MPASKHSDAANAVPGAGLAERGLIYRFADCLLDSRSLELRVHGQLVRLEPKQRDLLLFLLRNAGEVVTKDELQAGVWPGRVLSESVLTKTMALLRQALEDVDQVIIKTAHGYGYRLMAPVTMELVGPVQSAPQLHFSSGDVLPQRPHWKLVERLGAGGYGEVWLVEHDKTCEKRVYKFALDAPGLTALRREITLFRVLKDTYGERPDLMQFLDWNLEEPPYFTESRYVPGGSLPQWAEAQGGLGAVALDTRIELLALAAEALAAAHAAGVLHKDLKPSNLLIETDDQGAPYVRLGDFGSGRMVDLARLEQLEITRMGFTRAEAENDTTSGTPFYFAPELLAGQQPTIQTDIYALGVILYQVIVGDLKRPLAPGWEREIADELLREDIAAAAAGQAADRITDAAELARRLRTLDARRAERDRDCERRDAEQRALAAADRAQRQNEKLRLRRKWLSATVIALLAGLGFSLLLYRDASRARAQAEAAALLASRAAAHERAVTEFLYEDILTNVDIDSNDLRHATVEMWLDSAASNIERRFADNPQASAELAVAIGTAYVNIGALPKAYVMKKRGIEIARQAFKRQPEAALRIAQRLTGNDLDLLISRDDLAFWQQVREEGDRQWGAAEPRSLGLRLEIISSEFRNSDAVRAGEELQGLLPQLRALQQPGQTLLASALRLQASVLSGRSDIQGAEAAYRELYALVDLQSPTNQIQQAEDLGGLYLAGGRYDEAERWLKQGLELAGTRATDSFLLAARLRQLFTSLRLNQAEDGQRPVADAVLQAEGSYTRSRDYFGPGDEYTAHPTYMLARAYQLAGRLDEAARLGEDYLAMAEKFYADDERHLARLMLADICIERRHLDRAEALLREAAPDPASAFAGQPPSRAQYLRLRGLLSQARGDRQQARTQLQEALRIDESVFGAQSPQSRQMRKVLAGLDI